ncbi:MAG: VWA domain-containing protein [Vicinamibacteria bacterium]
MGLLVCLVLAAGPLLQEKPPEPAEAATPVIRISTELIQLDARVVDREGLAVTDLGVQDFEVLEGGERRNVTHVAWVGSREAARASSRPTTEPAPERIDSLAAGPVPAEGIRVVLFFDDLQLPFGGVARARRALGELIETSIQPGDQVAIVRSSRPTLDFTDDLETLRERAAGLSYNVISSSSLQPEHGVGGTFHPPFMAEPLPPSKGPGLNPSRALTSLALVLQALRAYPGRKTVLLLGEGWDWNPVHVGAALRGVTDQANRAAVVISAIDPSGLGLHADPPGAGARDVASPATARRSSSAKWETRIHRQAILEDLAGWTGGSAITNHNDTAGGLRRLLDDQRGYYLIGFEPGRGTFERDAGRPRFHEVQIKVKNENLTVRARRGFYGISDEDLARAGAGPAPRH